MAKRYYVSRLGGADKALLADEEGGSPSGERGRSAAMGGVLIITACVASLSMFFALYHGVGVVIPVAIPLALGWGVAIITIDRFLIITLSGTRGRQLQLIVTVFCRLVLAALIAFIVATPLVLQIFAKDIKTELPILQQQKSKQFAISLKNGADGRRLAQLTSQVASQKRTVNGDQDTVNKFTSQLRSANTKVSNAYTKWQCEAGGVSGPECLGRTSGVIGNGPLARADKQQWITAKKNAATVKGELKTAKSDLTADKGTLGGLKSQLSKEQARINRLASKDDQQNKHDTGLLAQIDALDAASAKNTGLAVAHWTVTALFFVIEILPVTIKSLLLLAPATAYESIVIAKGLAAIDQAKEITKAEKDAAITRAESKRKIAESEAATERLRAEIKQLEAQATRDARQAELRADRDVRMDMIRREKGTRIEANKRYATATREYILSAIDNWARMIRELIAQASQNQGSPNGQTTSVPSGQGPQTPPSSPGQGPQVPMTPAALPPPGQSQTTQPTQTSGTRVQRAPGYDPLNGGSI